MESNTWVECRRDESRRDIFERIRARVLGYVMREEFIANLLSGSYTLCPLYIVRQSAR